MTSIEVLTTTTSFSSNIVETTVETSETEVLATPTEPIANSIPAAHLVSAEVATQTQPLENETERQSIASSSSSSSIKDSGSSFANPEKKRTRLSRVFSNAGNYASNKKLTKEEREKLQEKRSKRRSFRLSGVFTSKEEKEATANKENVVTGDNNKKRRSLSEVFNREKNVDELLRRRKRDVPPKEVEEKQRKRRSFMELFSFSDGEDEEEKREQKRKEKQQKRMSLNLAELFGFSDDESQRKSRQIQEKEDMQNLSELLNFSNDETNAHKKQISDLFHYNHEHHKSYRNEELAMNNGEDADLNTSTTISTPNSPTEEDHIIDQNRVANTTTSQEIVREVSPSPPPTVELFKGTKIEVAATPIHTTKPPAVPVISTAKVVFAEDARTVSLSPISTSLRPTIATTPENNNERKSPRWSKDWKQGVKSLAIIEDNDIVDNEHSESEVKEGKTKGSETSSDESTASTAVIMSEDTHGKPTELENTVSLTTIKSQLESQVNQQSGQLTKLSPIETVMVRQLELVERMEQTMRRLETKVNDQREEMENLYTQRMEETIQRLEAKLNVQRDELDELRGFVDDLRNPKMLLTNESTTFALSMGQNRLIQEPYHTQQTSTAQSTTIALYDPHHQPLLGTTDYSSEMESTREMQSSTTTTTTNATTDELAIATTSYTMPTLVSSLVVNPLYKTVGIASMVLHTIYIRPVVGLVKVVREHVI